MNLFSDEEVTDFDGTALHMFRWTREKGYLGDEHFEKCRARKLGNCLACHTNSDARDQLFHRKAGRSLDGVANRWSAAELRRIVANARMTFAGTIMPAYCKDTGFNRPLEKLAGKTILTARQIEDVVAYLRTMKEQ